jgi:hypothetical protein
MPTTAVKRVINIETMLSGGTSFAVLIIILTLYYLFLLSNGTFQLFAPEMLDKAFNNMLVHLLRSQPCSYECCRSSIKACQMQAAGRNSSP